MYPYRSQIRGRPRGREPELSDPILLRPEDQKHSHPKYCVKKEHEMKIGKIIQTEQLRIGLT